VRRRVTLTGTSLTLDDVVAVARDGVRVALAGDVAARVARGRAIVDAALDGDPVYGLTTGVGVRKRTRVDARELAEFNSRLVLEHRVGQGDPVAPAVARAQLLAVVNAFARGTAGVRLELVEHLAAQLNAGAAPTVRTLGSIGMADLPANADLAHGVLGDFELAPKEALALLGSNAFSSALAALALADAVHVLAVLDVAAMLDLEALAGNVSPLHDAPELAALLEGSYLWDGAAARSLQDPLSFRCAPVVHGAAREAFAFAVRRLEHELNAAELNPLVLLGEGRLISVGGFDSLPLAQALDLARIALAPVLTSASERAVKLLQAPVTGLPEGLAAAPGLAESALSEFGVPAQAFAVEAKLLAQPVSIETASTSHHEGIEDRVTLAPLAARRLAQMVELAERLAAVELVIAAQAIDLRGRPQLGRATARAYEAVRARVPFTAKGEPPPQDLEPVRELVRSGLG
jgi:histidine ammonia-lyase